MEKVAFEPDRDPNRYRDFQMKLEQFSKRKVGEESKEYYA